MQRGLEAHRAGRIEEARNLYRAALKLDPQDKFAHFNLGVIDQLAGRDAAAESSFLQAISIDEEMTEAIF